MSPAWVISRRPRSAGPVAALALALGACWPLPALAAPAAPAAELLVKFESGASSGERASGHREVGAAVESRLPAEGVDVVDLPSGTSPAEALAAYRSNPDVAYVEPNAVLSIAGASNDLGTGLWALDNGGQDRGRTDADIDAPEAWELLGGNAFAVGDYTVGVVDTGIDAEHEDLAGKVVGPCSSILGGTGAPSPGCADDNGHGTHAAGTIAATGNNGRGVVGVAPAARILMCKALDSKGAGYVSDIVVCMNDIVARRTSHNIRVLSLSIGGGDSQTLRAAVDNAYASGVLVIAAAGNQGDASVTYPAGYANAVSVGATDRQDARASFSNANGDVEISAPGVGIVSTVPGGYATYSGTSMAAPHVAGAAALIASKQGGSAGAVRAVLAASVDDLGPAGRDASFGFGRLNLCRALGGSCGYGQRAAAAPAVPAARPTAAGDRTAPRAQAGWSARYELRSVLQGGLRLVCRVNEAATCGLSVELGDRDAKRVGLRGHGRSQSLTIASDSATLARRGSAALAARLTPSAARALARSRSVEVTLRLTVVDRAGNRSVLSRRATLGGGSGQAGAGRFASAR